MCKKKKFEVQTVTHRADLIFFTWSDLGGMYNVYRNGQLLYEGTVPEFGDGDFKHAKMYSYSIERVINDEVVDVIALQTSAFAEKRNVKNPLQFLVMTTIVAKSQIALSWEEIKDVHEYEIYRNGVYVKTTKENRYIDRNFSLDEPYTYQIRSKRPLAKSEEGLSGSKSILSFAFGKFIRKPEQLLSRGEPEIEGFTVTKVIAKPEKLLRPVTERPHRPDVNRWKLRYATFLEEAFIKNPNVFSRNRYFQGDKREFDPEGRSFRTRADIELAYDKPGMPLTFTKDVGATIAYDRLKQMRAKGVASTDGIVLERSDNKVGEAGFLLTHTVGNPLVMAPKIDYEVRAVLRRDGTFDLTGYHDQAPHHEIYLIRGEGSEWMPIHLVKSKGLGWMSRIVAWQYWRYSNFG